jgi:predicted membrane channel-forming protein YqfA (hemolysin III family)
VALTIGVVVLVVGVVVLVVEFFEQEAAKKLNIKRYIILGVIGEGLRIRYQNNNKV